MRDIEAPGYVHEPICVRESDGYICICDAIDEVREAEREKADARVDRQLLAMVERLEEQRERIAQEIDRLADVAEIRWRNEQHVYWEGARDAHRDAARIARSGGESDA